MSTDAKANYTNALQNIATKSEAARRRQTKDKDSDLLFGDLSPFRIDCDSKIGPSKAYRRLHDKTQVLTIPGNEHTRNRASHTQDVIAIATQICDILGLNVDLARAIAKGHDIGHPPFGHTGEEFISKITGEEFRHEVFACVIAQQIERKGRGLNLTFQTLQGILSHSRGANDCSLLDNVTPESNVVTISDKIGYTTADPPDIFVRNQLKFPSANKIMKTLESIGKTQRERINYFIESICQQSAENGKVTFSSGKAYTIFNDVKKDMYVIYPLTKDTYKIDVWGYMEKVYEALDKHLKVFCINPAVVFAIMTDDDVIKLAGLEKITLQDIMGLSVGETIPYLYEKNIGFKNPGLNW